MLAAMILASVLAGSLAAIAAWIAGLDFGLVALSYWTAGTLALLLTASLQIIFRLLGRWWWARTVEFRFWAMILQAGAMVIAGLSLLLFGFHGPLPIFMTVGGAFVVFVAPLCLTFAFDTYLAPPEPRRFEDYL